MSTPKHTPGPWIVANTEITYSVHDEASSPFQVTPIHGADGSAICAVEHDQVTVERLEANIRLIAQAPEFAERVEILIHEVNALQDEIAELESGWAYCPECGSDSHEHFLGYAETHRCCLNCNQEWHTDIDYSRVVRARLANNAKLREACNRLLQSDEVQKAWPLDGNKRAQKPRDTFSKASVTVRFRHLLAIHQALAGKEGA